VAPPSEIYAPGINALHYDVEIGLGKETNWFAGKVKVKIALDENSPVLPLDFSGLELLQLSVQGNKTTYSYQDGVIRIPLKNFQKNDTVVVELYYRGFPDDGLILNKNIHGERTAFVDNWPNRTRFWLPTIDHPTDKATVHYTIHAPKEWKVIANGYLFKNEVITPKNSIGPKEDRLTWEWDVTVPISTYNMVIGAAALEVRTVGLAACNNAPASQREDGCIEVTYWVYPQDVKKAEPSFRRAKEMVDYFTEIIGPFPFEKLANVQSATRFGGMENASAIFYSESGIAKGRNIEGTVSHEIAHQWFGDAVTQADWHHLWLSEGFATYFGVLFFEHSEGVTNFRNRMNNNLQRVLKSKVTDRPIIDKEVNDLFKLLNSNNYPKAGWVLHMLRGILGDEIFFKGIQEYYRQYLHKTVLTEDFQKITDPLNDLFAIEREEITKQELSGHFGNPILMLHVEVKKKRAEQFIKKLVSLIPRETMNELLTNIEERIFESSLYIRFSKQNLVKKILTLEEKDPIRIAIYTPTYVKKEIPDTYRKLLNQNND